MSCGVGEYGRLGLGDMASDATSPEPIEYIDDEAVKPYIITDYYMFLFRWSSEISIRLSCLFVIGFILFQRCYLF